MITSNVDVALQIWEEILDRNEIVGEFNLEHNAIITNLSDAQMRKLCYPDKFYYSRKKITNKNNVPTREQKTVVVKRHFIGK